MEKPIVLSAGVVIVRKQGERCRFLLLRVFNYWDFPKGEVEPGENPLDTAIREVREETGITDLAFPWGEIFIETPPYRSGKRLKVARYYLALTSQERVRLGINPELGKAEHDEYRWVDSGRAHRLLGERLRPVLQWAVDASACNAQG
ncbi:bis(5'-nucleosyl)-tetraphosphatase [Thiolapillus sp.]